MPDQRTSENWRLEEGGKEADKWLLQESEQQLSDQWQLQDQPAEPISSWQPVEYVKSPRPAGTWILPTIITLALLVTLGYAGYRVLPTILNGSDATPAAQEEAPAVVPGVATSAPAEEAASGEATSEEMTPLATQESAQEVAAAPAAVTATPTIPSTMVSQEFAVVNSPFGVNARFTANTDAPVIRILENGEELFVFGQQGDWIELFVADTPLTEGQNISGTVGFAATEFFTVSTKQVTQGLRDQVLAYTGKLPTATPEPTAAVIAPAPGDNTSITQTVATTPSVPILTVTINAINGVNVRREAAADDTNVIRLLENGAVLPATGRSADSKWIQVALPDGVNGWIAAEFLVPSGDITSLPVVDGTVAAPGATAGTPGAAPVGSTTVVTSGVQPPAPYTSVVPGDSAPAIIVTVPDGVNARKEPALESDVEAVVPQGAVLTATGRSADNQWVQVQLPTGVLAWIFRDTVTATPAVGALPAVGGATAVPILLPTPTPTPGTPTPESTATGATPAAATTPAATSPETTTVTAKVVPFFLPIYSGPNGDSDTVARSPRGADFVVIGQNEDGTWLQVTTSAGVTGWVVAGNVRVTGDVSTVPVVQ